MSKLASMIKRVAVGAGAVDYEIIRQNTHLIVDFVTERGTRVRAVLSKSPSDHRAEKNKIAHLKRLIKEKGY